LSIIKKGSILRKWEEVFPETDQKLYRQLGTVTRQAYGNHPALLIIDANNGFLGLTPKPVLEAIKEYRTSCGESGWVALANIKKLLDKCRTKNIPVIFTTGETVLRHIVGNAGKYSHNKRMVDLKADEIVELISPKNSELVIRKTKASAFFATPLLICLRSMEIDSLLITGGTTSGCVRASVVDAFSHGFRCFIVEECTFDRYELSHQVSLFDMNEKYADVISLDDALEYLESDCIGFY
jgi:maleamate amidohydrolase